MFQPRGRSGSKLTVVYDAEGREREAESREDEEQNVKLSETIDLLLAAGYFRARIKGLSPFDKVVGGMTWCITTCNFDVEVDLLFQDSSTIGQKIALVEKIVAVLPKMKCPYRIEPHQIQGMDFIHIYPVVQWLVKRAIETREEMGDMNRLFSVSQFNKYNKLPEDQEFEERKSVMSGKMDSLKFIYGPKRKYKRMQPLKHAEEAVRTQSTLLEFGRKHATIQRTDADQQDLQNQSMQTKVVPTEMSAEQEEKQIQALLGSMTTTDSQASTLAASTVGSMVYMQSEEIKKASDEYAQKQAELEKAVDKPGTVQYHRKMTSALQKQIEEKRSRQQQLEEQYQQKKQDYSEVRAEYDQLEALNQQIDDEMKRLEQLENGENKIVLEKLRDLVAVNDSIKEKEKQYKQKCKEELAELEAELDRVKQTGGRDEEDRDREEQIETQYATDKARLHKMRLAIAKKNREISSLQRRIDEVPSRSELSQYQRRFVELYNQMSAIHKETKQFYTLYNTLDSSRTFLDKEVNLLNSIHDNFIDGMSTQSNKDQFLKQFEKIVDGIKANRAKMEKQKEIEKMKRDKLNDDYLELLEKQRQYFKTVKDFKEELRRNDVLQSKLADMGQ